MQEFISILKYLATSNLINFVIMLLFLGWVLKKIDLNKTLNSSIEKIENSIKVSETKKSDTEKRLKVVNSAMEKLPQRIEKYDSEIKIRTNALKEKINENADVTISNIQKNIEKDFLLEEKKVSAGLEEFVLDKSVENATDKIKQALINNPELHSKFIDESLENLNKVSFK